VDKWTVPFRVPFLIRQGMSVFICPWLYRVVIKVLWYQPEGCRFEIRWAERIFLIYLILLAALGPGVHSASNINDYQKQTSNMDSVWVFSCRTQGLALPIGGNWVVSIRRQRQNPVSKKKLHGLSPQVNYTDRAIAACRRSNCQLLRIEGATWWAWQIPTAVFSVF
jgi:hypothetical protein